MKVTIIVNGKPLERNIPTSWEQVTFRQFLELDKFGNDITKVIAYFIGIDHEVLLKAKLIDMDKVIAVLGFLNRQAQPVIPTSICGYPVPKDLGFEEVQMFVDLKAYIAESKGLPPLEQLAKYPVYCGVYACKHRYGRYDFQLAEKLSEVFFNAPCTEVLGIGNFTLLKLTGLNMNIAASSRRPLTRWMKLKLVFKTWRKTSVHLQRWFSWRKKQAEAKMNY